MKRPGRFAIDSFYSRFALPLTLLALAYGFWVSAEFMQIAAGVAVFLLGMLSLEKGFETFTGGLFERLLRGATRGMGRSIGFGIATTALMQSSSLVSLLTISFLSAGLISLAAGIGVIFGANIGTTSTAWLIAGLGLKVKISAYAIPMLVFGVVLVFQRSRNLHGTGNILVGLGFLLLGLDFMKEGFEAFKGSIDLAAYAVEGYRGLLIYTFIGVAMTVIIQSSSATLVLIITALSAEQVTYANALALAIGSNVGTTITAIIGAISANVDGRRLAGAHLIFNMMTGLVAIVFMQPMMQAVEAISAAAGIGGDDYTLKLAVFHSLFNIVGLLLMLPFTKPLIRGLLQLFPEPASRFDQPRYLSESARQMPEAAIEAIRQETARLYDHAVGIIAHGIALPRHGLLESDNPEALVQKFRRPYNEDIEERYKQSIESIYSAIIEFSYQIQTGDQAVVAERIHALRNAGRNIMEAVKALQHMQKHLITGMNSEVRDLREQYDVIRQRIARVIRDIEKLKQQPEDTATALVLDQTRVEISRSGLVSDMALSKLVRDQKLPSRFVPALMKDADYAQELCGKLISAAIIIYGSTDWLAQDLERDIALTKEEIQSTIANRPSETL